MTETLDEAVARIAAYGETEPRAGRDPVNQPMINSWVEALGDDNPRWRTGEAPWAMAQVWTMRGLRPAEVDPRDPLPAMMAELTARGYSAVLGTDCEQTYHRTLRVGEEVTVTTALDSVIGPKRTGVGEGYFVTTRSTWRVGEEVVAEMLFRVLKYVPRPRLADAVLRPQVNRDTEYFWAGTRAGELRLQSCRACGALRHPPGPACPDCGALDRGYVVAAGTGTLYSYVVHRHPPVPGRELPILIGLVELPEGARIVGELVGLAPEDLAIGMPLVVDYQRVDDDLTLPVWRRA